MSIGKHLVDPAISKKHIDQSIAELLKRITLNRDYWIPYLAGYSKDWKTQATVFIDYRLPAKVYCKAGGHGTPVLIDVTRYLLIHECTEKSLMDDLGMPYILAHNLATGAERTAVEADGYAWDAYTDGLKPWIRRALYQPADQVAPKNLDLRPYIQEKFPGLKQLVKSEPHA